MRITHHKVKRSTCWFRIGVTDSAWNSSANTVTSPLLQRSASSMPEVKESFSTSIVDSLPENADSSINFSSEGKDNKSKDSDSDSDSENHSESEEGIVEDLQEDELDDLLVLQYIDNHVAKFIVGRDDDWVDANVVDSKNTYMLHHLQKTLEPLAQRVMLSHSRVVEESYDQLSFVDTKTIDNYGATLSIINYDPHKPENDSSASESQQASVFKCGFDRPPDTLQLYFDQTFFQTTVRIPLGGHFRGEFITCMVMSVLTLVFPSHN